MRYYTSHLGICVAHISVLAVILKKNKNEQNNKTKNTKSEKNRNN